MSVRVRLPLRSADLLAVENDRTLLTRFASDRDGEAFAAIVRRHGPMVLGICRRTVRDAHLAEDAFQASFLVLARRPHALRESASLSSWLFGVARRVALAARRRERRAKHREDGVRKQESEKQVPAHDFDDLLLVLDEELARLPEELRAPLIACFLDERTQDEAALHLGWSLSTLRRRLERGKEVLRERLSRRGVSLGAGLFAGWLAPSTANAGVTPKLVEAAVAATGPACPASVAALAAVMRPRGGLVLAVGVSCLALGLGIAAAAGAFDAAPSPCTCRPFLPKSPPGFRSAAASRSPPACRFPNRGSSKPSTRMPKSFVRRDRCNLKTCS